MQFNFAANVSRQAQTCTDMHTHYGDAYLDCSIHCRDRLTFISASLLPSLFLSISLSFCLRTTLSLLHNFISGVIGSATATAQSLVWSRGQQQQQEQQQWHVQFPAVSFLELAKPESVGVAAKSRREWKVKTTFTTFPPSATPPPPLVVWPLCAVCVCLSCISRCPFVLSPTAPRRRVVCLPFPRWEKLCHKFYVNSPKIVVIVLLQLLFSLLLHFCCSFYSSTLCWLLLLLSCRDKMHLNKLFLDQCRVILLVGAFPSYVHVSHCMWVCVSVGVGVTLCALTNLITS